MNDELLSLDDLRDIAVPPPVSWWPLAPGWWFLITAAASTLAYFAYLSWNRWRANAYRREALSELAQATNIAAVSSILKRTAIVAFSRSEVAALSGDRWCEWLQRTGQESMTDSVHKTFTTDVFTNAELSFFPEVLIFAESWIRTHERCSHKRSPDLTTVSDSTLVGA